MPRLWTVLFPTCLALLASASLSAAEDSSRSAKECGLSWSSLLERFSSRKWNQDSAEKLTSKLRKLREKPELESYVASVLQAIHNAPTARRDLSRRIHHPIEGLYESLPVSTDLTIEGIRFQTKIKGETLTTKLVSATGETVGKFIHIIFPSQGTLTFKSAHLARELVPGLLHVPGTIPLVPGRGIPTQTIITLEQMRLAGVKYGTLVEANTTSMGNVRDSLEILDSPEIRAWNRKHPRRSAPEKIIADAILSTHSGQYMSTVLTQSGHRIIGVEVTDSKSIPLSELLRLSNGLPDPSLAPTLIQEVTKEGVIKPFPPNQQVPINFKIKFRLAPFR